MSKTIQSASPWANTRQRAWGSILLLGAALLAGCGDPAEELVGTWSQFEGTRPQTRLILRADGTGKLEIPGELNYQIDAWALESKRHLEITIFDQQVLARFLLNDSSLEVSRVEAFEAMNGIYRRQEGAGSD